MNNDIYSCTYIEHLNQPIQGFCLSLECNCPSKQFCLNCFQEDNKHGQHKNDCKGFNEIQNLVQNSTQIFSNLYNSLEKLFLEVRAIYDIQLKELDAVKSKLSLLSQMLEEQDYYQLREKNNIQLLKNAYSLSQKIKLGQGDVLKIDMVGYDSRLQIYNLLQTSFEQIKMQSALLKNTTFNIFECENNNREISEITETQQLLEIGLQFMQIYEWEKAYQTFKQSIDKNKYDYKTLFFQSWVLIEINKCQEGLQLLEHCQTINPNLSMDLKNWCNYERITAQNSILTIALGYSLELFDNQEKAIQIYDKAISYDKRQTFAYARKGSLLLKFKIHDAALYTFEEGLNLTYNRALLHYYKGIALLEQKEISQALISFQAAAQFDAKFSLNNYHLGCILKQQLKFQEALQYLDQAITYDPHMLKAYESKSLTLCEMKQYNQALECLEEVLKINPKYKQAFHLKGNCLKLQRKYQEAIKCFDQALLLDSNYLYAYNLKGNCLLQMRNYKQAFQCYEKALQIDNQCIEAILNKGILLKELKRNKEAIEQYDLVLQIDSKCSQAYKNKGIALEESKKYEEAQTCYQMAIDFGDPQSDEIKKWLGQIKIKKGLSWMFGN